MGTEAKVSIGEYYERIIHASNLKKIDKLYTKVEVEALLSKIVSDSNIPKYTIQESGSSLRMDQVFPFRKWCDENL